MYVISHRGNLHGPSPEEENKPVYIDAAINSLFDVEVDIRYIEGGFYLGHDGPEYYIEPTWLKERKDYLWLHCKNKEALYLLADEYNVFYHDKDPYVLTSRKHIWCYPGSAVGPGCILVDLEYPTAYRIENIRQQRCSGICTDFAAHVCTESSTAIV